MPMSDDEFLKALGTAGQAAPTAATASTSMTDDDFLRSIGHPPDSGASISRWLNAGGDALKSLYQNSGAKSGVDLLTGNENIQSPQGVGKLAGDIGTTAGTIPMLARGAIKPFASMALAGAGMDLSGVNNTFQKVADYKENDNEGIPKLNLPSKVMRVEGLGTALNYASRLPGGLASILTMAGPNALLGAAAGERSAPVADGTKVITPQMAARNAALEQTTGSITPAQARVPMDDVMQPNKYSDYEKKTAFTPRAVETKNQQMKGLDQSFNDIATKAGGEKGTNPLYADISEHGQTLRDQPAKFEKVAGDAFEKTREFLEQLPKTINDRNLAPDLRQGIRNYMETQLGAKFITAKPKAAAPNDQTGLSSIVQDKPSVNMAKDAQFPAGEAQAIPGPWNRNMKVSQAVYNKLVEAYRGTGILKTPANLLTQRQNFAHDIKDAFASYVKGTPNREARVQDQVYQIYNDVLNKHIGENFPQFKPYWEASNAAYEKIKSQPFKDTKATLEGANDAANVARDLVNGKEAAFNDYEKAFNGNADAMQKLKSASTAELYRRSLDKNGKLDVEKFRNAWDTTFTPAMKTKLYGGTNIKGLFDDLLSKGQQVTALDNYRRNSSGTAQLADLMKGGSLLSKVLQAPGIAKNWAYYGPLKNSWMPRVARPVSVADRAAALLQRAAPFSQQLQGGQDE